MKQPPAVWGEKATRSCLQRKLAGVVINGAIRDVADIREMRFPAFAKLITPTAGDPKGQGMIDVPVRIGGQNIRTGDWIVGDDDGVVVGGDGVFWLSGEVGAVVVVGDVFYDGDEVYH